MSEKRAIYAHDINGALLVLTCHKADSNGDKPYSWNSFQLELTDADRASIAAVLREYADEYERGDL